MFKHVRLKYLLLLIVTNTFSLPALSHVINWQLSTSIIKNSQSYDSNVKWLENFPLYLPIGNDTGLVETPISGLTQVQVFDHPVSQSIANLSNLFINELIHSGFDVVFQCSNSDCNHANQWNISLKDYLFDLSERQAYLVAYRTDSEINDSAPPTINSNTNRGEYLHIYLNEIGCCVRSIWRYTDLNQSMVTNKFPALLFDHNSSQLSVSTKLELEVLIRELKTNSKRYRIVGHTDSLGTESYNLQLSENRSISVVNYMLSRGISADRLVQKSMGSSQPLVENDNIQNRHLNRRVEIISEQQD